MLGDCVNVQGVTHDLFHLCFSYIIQFHQWVCSKGLHLALSGLLPIMLPIIIVLVGALLSVQTHTCTNALSAPKAFQQRNQGVVFWSIFFIIRCSLTFRGGFGFDAAFLLVIPSLQGQRWNDIRISQSDNTCVRPLYTIYCCSPF